MNVGETQEVVGDQQTVFPLPVYVLPPCLPACPLAINVTLSYPPHTHMATGRYCALEITIAHGHTHACTKTNTHTVPAADAK